MTSKVKAKTKMIEDPMACPRCGRKYKGRVFLCGGCGYLRDEKRFKARAVPSKRYGVAMVLERK